MSASSAADPLDALTILITESASRSENEADTRHRIIDVILHDVLAWPRNAVSTEEHIGPGYADYSFKRSTDQTVLFLEAKKSGLFFTLPHPHQADETSCYISISKLLSDENTAEAMRQVRNYCLDTGCEYGGITNGHEWVFFRIFERGKRWEALKAFVVRNLSFFKKEYTKAYNSFSYTSVIERGSLVGLLATAPSTDRSIFYLRDRIPTYSHTITANKLAATLRPLVNHFFGVIGDDDQEFMDRCYVSQRDYTQTFDGVRALIARCAFSTFCRLWCSAVRGYWKGRTPRRPPNKES